MNEHPYTDAEIRAAKRLNEVDAAIGPSFENDDAPCNEWGGYEAETPWSSVLVNELDTIGENGLDRDRVMDCQKWLQSADATTESLSPDQVIEMVETSGLSYLDVTGIDFEDRSLLVYHETEGRERQTRLHLAGGTEVVR